MVVFMMYKDSPKTNFVDSNAADKLKICFNDMKVLLILMVVMVHSNDSMYPENAINGLSLPYRFIGNLFNLVINVPHLWMFFFISGYLYFSNMAVLTKDVYITKMKNRVHSLLVPYLLWPLIMVFFYALKNNIMHGVWDFSHYRELMTWQFYWNYHGAAPYMIPLWFIRDLMVISILSPLVYLAIKRFPWFLIPFAMMLMVSSLDVFWSDLLSGFFFFSLGSLVSLYRWNLCRVLEHYRYGLLLATLLCVAVELFAGIRLPDLFGCILGGADLLWIFYRMTRSHGPWLPKALTGCSFFVYLSHGITIEPVVISYMMKFMPDTLPGTILIFRYLICAVMTYLVCAALYHTMRLIMPKMLSVLCGGRV